MLTIDAFGCAWASTVEIPVHSTAAATMAHNTRLKRDMRDSFAPAGATGRKERRRVPATASARCRRRAATRPEQRGRWRQAAKWLDRSVLPPPAEDSAEHAAQDLSSDLAADGARGLLGHRLDHPLPAAG